MAGSTPYIDNSAKKLFGDKYDSLDDPYMYPDQQMIIAQLLLNEDSMFMVLQFDRSFKKIIDGALCKEVEDIDDIAFEYTHSFNNWIDKKKGDSSYYRRRFDFLTEEKEKKCFIQSKHDQEKDDEDKEREDKIRNEITQKTADEWYEKEADFRQKVSIAKTAVGIGFGILEDIPQLVIQCLNSIMIGQTMSNIQLMSPLTSTISAFVRIYSIGSWDLFPESDDMSDKADKKCQVLCAMTMFNIFVMGVCIFPILVTVIKNYYT